MSPFRRGFYVGAAALALLIVITIGVLELVAQAGRSICLGAARRAESFNICADSDEICMLTPREIEQYSKDTRYMSMNCE